MKKRLSGFAVLFLLVVSIAFTNDKKIKVYLVGDSTMANKSVAAYPENGWGMPFRYFFDSSVEVENTAQNGRSTRTFIEEKRWQAIMDKLQADDYVLVQFGHNDEVETKKSYTKPEEFVANLTRYVNDARSKGAYPILITPVARRKFDSAGKAVDTHAAYSELVVKTAAQLKVPLIDLNTLSRNLIQQMGVESSAYLFNHLVAGEHPNYPDGKIDDTHFSEMGARKMAEIVLAEIKRQHIPLADKIVKRK